MTYYVLDDTGQPTPADYATWGAWRQTADRHVARDELPDGVTVSTVFLALNYQFTAGPWVLWETMIFGGEYDQAGWRYTSRADAEAGHARVVDALRDGRNPEDGCE